MNKTLVFAAEDYYPNGGAQDFVGAIETGNADELIALLISTHEQIVDIFTFIDIPTMNRYGIVVDTVRAIDRWVFYLNDQAGSGISGKGSYLPMPPDWVLEAVRSKFTIEDRRKNNPAD